jgi:hypothetical protein
VLVLNKPPASALRHLTRNSHRRTPICAIITNARFLAYCDRAAMPLTRACNNDAAAICLLRSKYACRAFLARTHASAEGHRK